MAQLNFFSPIDPEKKGQVIADLIQSGNDLRIKIREQHYRSKILSKKEENTFSIYKFIPGNFQFQEAIFSFDGSDGKYFFQATISTQGSELTLSMPEKIFRLVRRNDFRVDIPPDNGYPCSIISVNGKKKSIPAELRNISLGGCQISVAASQLTPNKEDEIAINLTIKDYEWTQIKIIVKQVRPANDKGDVLLAGTQFKEPDADFLTEVQSALMFLDRTHRHRH